MWRVGPSRQGPSSEQETDHNFQDFLHCYGLQRLFHRSPSKLFVLITPVTILVLVFLEMNPVLSMFFEKKSRAEDDCRNEPSANVDSRNGLCVEADFQRDDETFLGVRKVDVTCLDVQTDGVTLPVPGSSSSFRAQLLLLDHVRINVRT